MEELHPPKGDRECDHGEVPELVDPDPFDPPPPRLGSIDEDVADEDQRQSLWGDVFCQIRVEQTHDEGSGVGQAVVDQHFPTLSLFGDHPDALEREVPDHVECPVDEEPDEWECEAHGALLGDVPTGCRDTVNLSMSCPGSQRSCRVIRQHFD